MISDGLNRNFSTISKDFVGIESRVKEIMTLLSIGSDDVRFIGICGMGGIGKTTLSTAIYERVSPKFEASCFIKEARSHSLVIYKNKLFLRS
jgi:ABC-type dipeptide/oligopeptide/nickel transport system ATPase subunit